MSTLKNVLKYLNEDPPTRDSDELLIAKFWYHEMFDKNISAIQFLVNYSEGQYTSADFITRCRRKLQEETPGLRGASYSVRHKKDYKQLFK